MIFSWLSKLYTLNSIYRYAPMFFCRYLCTVALWTSCMVLYSLCLLGVHLCSTDSPTRLCVSLILLAANPSDLLSRCLAALCLSLNCCLIRSLCCLLRRALAAARLSLSCCLAWAACCSLRRDLRRRERACRTIHFQSIQLHKTGVTTHFIIESWLLAVA